MIDNKRTEFRSEQSDSDRNEVTRFFDAQANTYSSFFDPNVRSGAVVLFSLRRRIAIELSSGHERGTVIDIATGTGEISYAIASSSSFREIHLNDLSQAMLACCRKAFAELRDPSRITWSNEEAFELLQEFGGDRFDLILCLGMIAHTGRLRGTHGAEL